MSQPTPPEDFCYQAADGSWHWRPARDVNPEQVVPVAVSEDGNYIRLSNDRVLERVPRYTVQPPNADKCMGCYYRSTYVDAFLHAGPDAEADDLTTGDTAIPNYCAEALGMPPCQAGKPYVTNHGVAMSGVVFKHVPSHHARKILDRHFHG